MYKLALLSFLALAPFAAGATIQSSGSGFAPEKGLDLSDSFEAQRSAILTALNDGKTYAEITPENASQVRTSLDRISRLLDGKASVSELHGGAKVEVFNEQERINTLLTRAHEDSRLVCRREKATGSNRPTNVCATVAERRRLRDSTYQAIKDMRHSEAPTIDR